jgi:acyl-CoA thioesterase
MEGEATLMTFVELMGLAELRDRRATDDSDEDEPRRENRFMSLNEAFHPGGEAAYGGHVYAQAVWAASMTVDEEMVVHVSV